MMAPGRMAKTYSVPAGPDQQIVPHNFNNSNSNQTPAPYYSKFQQNQHHF